ncbi:YegP family protein [Aliarcobacter butzleri]|uniref:YegP family protein n=1 Tax=Aliarcobacter butzleri TaxID=28197 RepID=UPI0021B3C734|nr:YegP family protein [Aliarcobacter butzleri]MCT7630953.1 YegP family protein [Aliarcobacter butzleri]
MSNYSEGYYVLIKHNGIKQPYHWVLKAPNHEVILKSENYASKHAALNGIESTQKHSPFDENYQRLEASDGSHYFNLKAKNHEIIGTSETYTTKAMRDYGIEAVKKYGVTSYIKDETGSDNGDIGLVATLVLGNESHAKEKPTPTKKPEKSGLANRYA